MHFDEINQNKPYKCLIIMTILHNILCLQSICANLTNYNKGWLLYLAIITSLILVSITLVFLVLASLVFTFQVFASPPLVLS